jgi:hypothetical protein
MVMADEPAAYWRLGEAAADPVVHNETILGDAYNGAFYLNVVVGEPGLIACDPDTAVRIRGDIDSRIEMADILDFASRAPFSLEAWVHLSAVEYGAIVRKMDTTSGYSLWYNEAGLEFRMLGGVETTVDAPLAVGTTYHLVSTYDGANMCLYVNAATPSCVPTAALLVNTLVPLVIGRSMNGFLDEVAIYPRALSHMEILAHYRVGARDP